MHKLHWDHQQGAGGWCHPVGARAGATLDIFKPSSWRVSAFLVPERAAQIWLGESGGYGSRAVPGRGRGPVQRDL